MVLRPSIRGSNNSYRETESLMDVFFRSTIPAWSHSGRLAYLAGIKTIQTAKNGHVTRLGRNRVRRLDGSIRLSTTIIVEGAAHIARRSASIRSRVAAPPFLDAHCRPPTSRAIAHGPRAWPHVRKRARS